MTVGRRSLRAAWFVIDFPTVSACCVCGAVQIVAGRASLDPVVAAQVWHLSPTWFRAGQHGRAPKLRCWSSVNTPRNKQGCRNKSRFPGVIECSRHYALGFGSLAVVSPLDKGDLDPRLCVSTFRRVCLCRKAQIALSSVLFVLCHIMRRQRTVLLRVLNGAEK